MLSASLFDVMDKSDGFIYIDNNNLPLVNFIDKSNINSLKTKSPWLFLETIYASKLREVKHARPKIKKLNEVTAGLESYPSSQPIDFEYTTDIINSKIITSVKDAISLKIDNKHPLIALDEIYNILDKS